MKKKLTIALSLLVIAAIAIGGTLAYFSMSTEEIENVFTVGKNVTITLVDIFNPDSPVTPDTDIKKEVGIENAAADGGSSVYAAVTAEFKYYTAETYPGTSLQKYTNIITADDFAALSAAEQANYTEITSDSSYIGYYIKADAVTKTYWTIDDTATPPTETQVTDAAAIAAGEYNKTKATYDSGEPVFSADATYAAYGETSALWDMIKLQHKLSDGTLADGINEPDWQFVGNYTDPADATKVKAVFVCQNELAPGEYSSVFDSVHVNDVNPVYPFSITVKGYAVQSGGFADANTAIESAFGLPGTP